MSPMAPLTLRPFGFPFAGPPLVDVRPFPVPSPGFSSEAALAFADQLLLEAAAHAEEKP